LLTHLRSLRDQHGLDVSFSVGFTVTERVQWAIVALPETAWTPAVDADGGVRAGADVAELTGMLPDLTAAVWPERMRMIVRRERPQSRRPAVLHRHQRLAVPGLRHRHPDRATRRAGGPAPRPRHRRGPHPLRQTHRAGTLPVPTVRDQRRLAQLALTACDLIAWTQTILLHGDLARCEPKTLRYRLLHVAARITRGGRRVFVRIAAHWPWRHELAAAFARLAALQPLRN
jgi:hypothetical protein